MARWNAEIRLPDFPTKREAEAYAAVEHSRNLIRVYSVVDEEIAREEQEARERTGRRLKQKEEGDGDGA